MGEQYRFFQQYAETLRSYERVFGPAPADLWPDARRRLTQDHKARRVHPRDAFVVPRWHAGIAVALIGLAAVAGSIGAMLLRSG
jgi:hypothetical protein